MQAQTVTLAVVNTQYNLLALILAARGYTLNTSQAPQIQQSTTNLFMNPVHELQLTGDSGNGAGIIVFSDANGNKGFQLQAGQNQVFRSDCDSIDLGSYFIQSSTAGVKLNVTTESV